MGVSQVRTGFFPGLGWLRPLVVLLVLLAGLRQPAQAEIWGYVDDQGVAHFASERLDERYELFSRTAEGLETGRGSQGADDTLRPLAVPMLPHKLIAFFEVSPNYKQVKHLLREAARDYRIDYELLQALIATESGFDATAVSPKGAVGLMQIMPATAGRFGVKGDRQATVEKKLTDPRTNIRVGARYLRDLMAMFPGQLELALAAYNAGAGAVLRAGGQVPPYKETQGYVRTVKQLYAVLKPPAVLAEQRRAPARVRMELPGGAAGRGHMLAPIQSAAATHTDTIETD